jgi:hypothetical protein
MQYAVDFGDRRVMAGVHYPSDNLGSWLLALDLIPRVCSPDTGAEVKRRIWTAISARSVIFRILKRVLGGSQEHVYRSAWDELHKRAAA